MIASPGGMGRLAPNVYKEKSMDSKKFTMDLAGKELTLEFYKFLRPERKFPSLEELRAEILKNGEETRKFFENF